MPSISQLYGRRSEWLARERVRRSLLLLVLVWTWGCNDGAASQPVLVVSSDQDRTCAVVCEVLSADASVPDPSDCGGIVCWGDGEIAPQPLLGINDARALQIGQPDCAILADETLRCWGSNEAGELGRIGPSLVPQDAIPVPLPNPVVAFGVSRFTDVGHACAIDTEGLLWCWGLNDHGQLGDGSTALRDGPIQVLNLTDVTDVAMGPDFTCAIRAATDAFCWGRNDRGQLGDGTFLDRAQPLPVIVSDVQTIAAGETHVCAARTGGDIFCWGANDHAQLGTGFNGPDVTVAQPAIGRGTNVQLGAAHTCARDGERVVCWGDNAFDQTGLPGGGDSTVPFTMPFDTTVGLVLGTSHSCAQVGLTDLRCWGDNSVGQLGSGTGPGGSVPRAVVGF